MKLKDLYERAVKVGIENDPRGTDSVQRELETRKKKYQDMPEKEKEFFDKDSLWNPYSDTRILNGTGEEEIKTILAGIDIEVPEVLLADALTRGGTKVDLILAHHPEGMALANLYDVMKLQSELLWQFGVPVNIAESLMEGRISEVKRRLMPLNHQRTVDAARVLGYPLMCLHTPADNMVATFLQRLFDEKKPYTISDILDILLEIPEYREAAKKGSGPEVLLGNKDRKAGKVYVDMTGGTEGAKDIFQALTLSGVNTIVAMHLSEEHRKEAEKHHLNVVIAGHIASDNLGLNLLLDEVLEDGVKVIECSGFVRIKRK
ncbi:MAG: NGG1p interacting factor NIF3 [Nitrospirae bacterium]|nr:MAG: NGG1p interacting factor NIF3 [Nitrospirota bacterium]